MDHRPRWAACLSVTTVKHNGKSRAQAALTMIILAWHFKDLPMIPIGHIWTKRGRIVFIIRRKTVGIINPETFISLRDLRLYLVTNGYRELSDNLGKLDEWGR